MLTIKNEDGAFIMKVDATQMVKLREIMDCVTAVTSIPADQQRIVYAGRRLHDEDSLADLALDLDGMINLVISHRGGGVKKLLKRTQISKTDKVKNLIAKFDKGHAKVAHGVNLDMMTETLEEAKAELKNLMSNEMSLEIALAKLSIDDLDKLTEFVGGQGDGGIVRKIPKIVAFMFPVYAKLEECELLSLIHI